jgi:hypothetical protein
LGIFWVKKFKRTWFRSKTLCFENRHSTAFVIITLFPFNFSLHVAAAAVATANNNNNNNNVTENESEIQ